MRDWLRKIRKLLTTQIHILWGEVSAIPLVQEMVNTSGECAEIEFTLPSGKRVYGSNFDFYFGGPVPKKKKGRKSCGG